MACGVLGLRRAMVVVVACQHGGLRLGSPASSLPKEEALAQSPDMVLLLMTYKKPANYFNIPFLNNNYSYTYYIT